MRKKIFLVAMALAVLSLLAMAPGAPAQTSSARHRTAQAAAAHTSSAEAGPPVEAYGSKSAPVTMEVFSDFQCPACRGLYEETLKELIKDYVAAGKVYLVHRDFPLSIHKYSFVAARYANAAARIGKYPEVEEALYDNQPAWEQDGNIEKFVAAAVGPADMKRIDRLMEDGCKEPPSAPGVTPAKLTNGQAAKTCTLDAAIEKDIALGRQAQVNQTPTIVISGNGQKSTSPGGVPYPTLKQYFDYLISLKK